MRATPDTSTKVLAKEIRENKDFARAIIELTDYDMENIDLSRKFHNNEVSNFYKEDVINRLIYRYPNLTNKQLAYLTKTGVDSIKRIKKRLETRGI